MADEVINGEDMRATAMELAKEMEDGPELSASTLAEQLAGREALARVHANKPKVEVSE